MQSNPFKKFWTSGKEQVEKSLKFENKFRKGWEGGFRKAVIRSTKPDGERATDVVPDSEIERTVDDLKRHGYVNIWDEETGKTYLGHIPRKEKSQVQKAEFTNSSLKRGDVVKYEGETWFIVSSRAGSKTQWPFFGMFSLDGTENSISNPEAFKDVRKVGTAKDWQDAVMKYGTKNQKRDMNL